MFWCPCLGCSSGRLTPPPRSTGAAVWPAGDPPPLPPPRPFFLTTIKGRSLRSFTPALLPVGERFTQYSNEGATLALTGQKGLLCAKAGYVEEMVGCSILADCHKAGVPQRLCVSRWVDAGKFLTGFSAVGSIAIPAILYHSEVHLRPSTINGLPNPCPAALKQGSTCTGGGGGRSIHKTFEIDGPSLK